MSAALPLFVAIPLGVAGILIGVHLPRPVRRALLLVTLAANLTGAGGLLAYVWSNGLVAHRVGLWDGGLAIVLVADLFAALMLVVTVLMSLLTALFARASRDADKPLFAPLVLIVTAGVNGALLTGDLFNLFVFVEIMLLPSYALILLAHRGQGRRDQVAASRVYVTVNLLTSTIFLIGIALIYGGTGTVNLGDLAGASQRNGTALLGSVVLLCALGIKAAVFPAHGWLGRTYPAMPPVVTALFSSLHTKVAVYAIFRVGTILFAGTGLGWVGATIFVVSMIVGVLGAIGESDARSILSFHMVSQIGYVLVGLALYTPAGIAAGVFYLIHNILAKSSLFLTIAAAEQRYGHRPLGHFTGLLWREPVTGVAFLAGAISLAGLPPLSGFVAKYAILTASFSAGQWAVGIAALAVSLFTLMSMLKIWGATFLGKPNPPLAEHEGPRIGAALIAPAVTAAGLSLLLGVGAQLLLHPAELVGAALLDPTLYLEAVRGR